MIEDPEPGDLTSHLIETDIWSDNDLYDAGIPVADSGLVTVGGGIGSFAMADTLRIAGAPTSNIRVLTGLTSPDQTYRYLASNSQIPDHERLRSDSSSTIDNIWGFPSYALREAMSARGLRAKLDPVWNVVTEPIVRDFYTPRAGDVYSSIASESQRIGWGTMLRSGQARMVRRRNDGGYFTLFTPPRGSTETKRMAFRSNYVHLAVGYPGVRFLPDLQAYRETYSDYSRVVNAYEPHDHVYEKLRNRPGTVVVRGSGIVASRILSRLLDDRDAGAQTKVLHLFRNYVHGPQGDSAWMRRSGADGFAYQGFNFPKAAWGGQLKERLEKLDGQGRKELIAVMGGTNTPVRKAWQDQIERGRAGGWYSQYVGEVTSVEPGPSATVITNIRTPENATLELAADVIIDATGLESNIDEHRLLADLLRHTGARKNASGRLDVERTFEIAGTQSGQGRMYASGSATLGGYYAGVDSFLGLQYAALAIADDLADHGFVQRLGTLRSVREWWRWMRKGTVPDEAAGTVRP